MSDPDPRDLNDGPEAPTHEASDPVGSAGEHARDDAPAGEDPLADDDPPAGEDALAGDDELSRIEAALEHDIDEVLAERDQFRDIAQRLQADFDNYRKRAAVHVSDEVARSTGRLAEAFLPVLDAAEAAYVRHPDEVGPLLNLLLSELKKHGLETLDLDGQPFDPEVAEAVAHESGGGGEVVVAEVLRSGYRWKGKTLRAAMVRTRD